MNSSARERILAAAEEVFSTRGYSEVSIRDIAEAAQVSPALVMKHGGSKAELFRAAARVVPSTDPYAAPLPELGRWLVQRTVASQREGRPSPMSRSLVLVVGAPDPDELRSQLHRAYLVPLVQVLADAGVPAEEASRRGQAALALLVGLSASLRMLHSFDDSDDDLVARYAELVQRALDGR